MRLNYPMPMKIAGALAHDSLFFLGTMIGSVLGGAEQALDTKRRAARHLYPVQ